MCWFDVEMLLRTGPNVAQAITVELVIIVRFGL